MTTLALTKLDSMIHRLAEGWTLLRSAAAASAAVDAGRKPSRADLEMLGIDPRAFSTIGHG